MLRPHFFTNAFAFALGVPVLWVTVAMHQPQPGQPKLARGTMSDIAFAGAESGTSVGAVPVAKADAPVDVVDTRGSTASASGANFELPDDLRPVSTDFDLGSGAANGQKFQGLFRTKPLRGFADSVAALSPAIQATTGAGLELLPPPLVGAEPFGVIGGYGGGGGVSLGSEPTRVYLLWPGGTGSGVGIIGWLSSGSGSGISSGGTSGDGSDTGGLADSLGWGFQAAPEPASWLLGLGAAAVFMALRWACPGARNKQG